MMRKSLLLTTLISGLIPQLNSTEVYASIKPNLLYIFPDQYRLHALSLWSDPEFKKYLRTQGDPVSTPNIDRLAKQGALFTQATSTHPVSSPHRAMLLSGMYPSQNGVEDTNCRLGQEQELHHDITCITDVLYSLGYETAYIGKTHWHKTEKLFDKSGNYVGETGQHAVNRFDTYIPEGKSRHSVTYWYQQLIDYHFDQVAYSNRPELVAGKKDGEAHRPKQFTTTVEADIIIDYLENKNGQRDAQKPFCLFWAPNPPHNPYYSVKDCKEDVFNTYFKDMPLEDLLVRKNLDLQFAQEREPKGKGVDNYAMNARVYFSLIKSIDDEIGRVLDKLKEIGEESNTVVVFTSDHGEQMGSHSLMGKNQIYEESFLVPFVIRYPSRLKHHVNDLMLGSVDIMPTLLGLMGYTHHIPKSVMGEDYSMEIVNHSFNVGKKPKSALYLNMKKKGVRSDRYSYVVSQDGKYELYDNVRDPYQKRSLKLNHISSRDREFLQRELGAWLKKAKDSWYDDKIQSNLIIY